MNTEMRDATRTNWHLRVEHALTQIFLSLDHNLDWHSFAEELNASPWHFHRCFKRLTGETVNQCIRRLRLEKAASRIVCTSARITDIALEAGFETLEAFLKAFRKAHGITPGRMRELGAWRGILPAPSNLHYQPGKPRQHFFIDDVGDHHMEVKITSLSSQKLYCQRNIGDYWGLPGTWKKFVAALNTSGYPYPPKSAMTVFHDHHDGVPCSKKRADAAFSKVGDIDLGADIFEYETPGGLYAVKVHFGSTEEIGPAWERWRTEWLPTSGWALDVSRPSLEWYQNNPDHIPAELLITLLCDPVTLKQL